MRWNGGSEVEPPAGLKHTIPMKGKASGFFGSSESLLNEYEEWLEAKNYSKEKKGEDKQVKAFGDPDPQ